MLVFRQFNCFYILIDVVLENLCDFIGLCDALWLLLWRGPTHVKYTYNIYTFTF